MNLRILRRKEVRIKTGESDSTRDRKEKKGVFPKRVQLGSNSIGWYEHEIDEYLANLPRGNAEEPKLATTASLKSRGHLN